MIEMKESENPNPKRKKFKLEDCVICTNMRNDIYVLYPCGHAKTCESCSLKILYMSRTGSNCPVCRQEVKSYVKAFF